MAKNIDQIGPTSRTTDMLFSAAIISVIAGVVSGAPSASPVLSAVSDTARFSWEIPQGGLGPDVSFYTVSPAGVAVFIVTGTGIFLPTGSYTNRLVYQGNTAARNVTFTLSNIQTSDAGTYTCGGGGATAVIQNCGQKLVVLGKPTTPGRPVSTTPVYNQQVTLTCSSTSTTVPADHGLTLTYTWQRNNTNITVTSPGSPYTFTVSSRDSLSYRCRVRESQGLESEWSQGYNMEPQYGPYQISLTPPTSSYTVTEHQALPSITCSSLCRPGCTYRWLHNGTAFSSGAMLQGQADRSKTGSYRCQPSNTHGSSDSVTVSVDVQYPAEVVLETQGSATCRPHRVYVGQQNVQLTCRVTAANPAVTSYTWTHNSSVIQSAIGAVFNISSVSRTSGGSYTCQGKNSLGGSTSSSVTLEVQYGPSVSVVASTQTVTEGQTLAVTCSVDSKPAATVTWTRKDGSSFTSQTGFTLTISNIQRSQAGTYVCTATNTLSPCGGASVVRSASVEVTVVVHYAPVITSVPSNKGVTENTSPNIDCSSNITPGNPSTTSYRWTGPGGYSKDGAVLDRLVTRTQGGVYTCTATTTAGLSDTAQVNINVQYAPVISSVPSNKDVTENTSPNIDCSSNITPGNPSTTSYRWTGPGGYSKDGAVLDRLVTRTQGGVYTCTATNTPGLSDTALVNINVQYPANVSMFTANLHNSSLTVNESDPVTLRCKVDSNPRSVIRLLNGTEELTRTDNSLTSEYRLESVDCRQRGNYSCTATNNIGTPVSQRVELLVKCSPRLDETMSHQLNYASRLGGNVNVSVSVLSYPLPTFTWSRTTSTSQNLTGSSSSVSDISVTARLHLTNLQQQDFGDYSLTVDNGEGVSVAYTLSIVSEGPPSTPTNVSVYPEGPFSLRVSWKEEFNGGAAQNFTVEYNTDEEDWKTAGSHEETGSGNYLTSVIRDLNSGTVYYVRVVASNKFGSSNYTEHVTGQTEKKVEPPPPPAGLIGGVAGGVVGVVFLVVIVVVVVVVIRRRGTQGEDTERITSEGRGKDTNDKLEMKNDIYESADRAEMQDNVCYASSDEVMKPGASGSQGAAVSDVYAAVDKKKLKPALKPNETCAKVQKPGNKKAKKQGAKKDKAKKVCPKDDKTPLKSKKRERTGEAYENTGIGEEGNPYINHGFDDQPENTTGPAAVPMGAKSGRDEDGLLYVGIDFSNHNPSPHVHREEESTEYAGIQIGVVGPAPKDEEKNEEEK